MSDENIIYGQPAIQIPNVSVGEFMMQLLRTRGDEIAQIDSETKVTQSCSDIYARSILIAEHLRQLGIRPRDVVGISSENNLDFILAILAAFYVGAAVAPYNPTYTQRKRFCVKGFRCITSDVAYCSIHIYARGVSSRLSFHPSEKWVVVPTSDRPNVGQTNVHSMSMDHPFLIGIQNSLDELLHTMSISRPRIIFASALTIRGVIETANKIDSVREVVLIGRSPAPAGLCGFKTIDDVLHPLCSRGLEQFIPSRINPEDTALILSSSGTTGLPKGVELSHRNFLYFLHLIGTDSYAGVRKGECVSGLLPFFHGYGLGIILGSIFAGVPSVVMSRFEENLFLQGVQDCKISVLYLVPPLMVFLGKHPAVSNYDLSHVKTIVSGAAPLSKDAEDAVAKRLGVKDIRQGYGMTETSILATSIRDGEVLKSGSSGKLVRGMMAKVIDIENGKTLPRYKEGEICFKGPNIMKGYRSNPKATAETIDEDGWLHTGDIGYFDSDGYIFIVDRLKELIKFKGFQVAPAELEAILYTHTGIRDAAVIGKPDGAGSELPVAFVVLQPNTVLTEQEIVGYVAERVSPQKRLRGGVQFVQEIPRNPSGKILRRILRGKL